MFAGRPGVVKASLVLLLGVAGDWISTWLGLARGLAESNPLAQTLMEGGKWIQADLLAVTVCLATPLIAVRATGDRRLEHLFLLPLAAGLARLLAAAWNLALL